jgi:hypothetical protein
LFCHFPSLPSAPQAVQDYTVAYDANCTLNVVVKALEKSMRSCKTMRFDKSDIVVVTMFMQWVLRCVLLGLGFTQRDEVRKALLSTATTRAPLPSVTLPPPPPPPRPPPLLQGAEVYECADVQTALSLFTGIGRESPLLLVTTNPPKKMESCSGKLHQLAWAEDAGAVQGKPTVLLKRAELRRSLKRRITTRGCPEWVTSMKWADITADAPLRLEFTPADGMFAVSASMSLTCVTSAKGETEAHTRTYTGTNTSKANKKRGRVK